MTIYNCDGQPLLEAADGIKHFEELNLIEPSFAGLELETVLFDSCNLVRADFKNTDLYGARFYDTNCALACFKGASLRGANLFRSNFASCDFTDADLNKDNLDGTAGISDCNFQSANLVGADFSGIRLENTNFTGATYSHRTRFPGEFDPATAGMIQVEDPKPSSAQRTPPYYPTSSNKNGLL